MAGFTIITSSGKNIRFNVYLKEAPVTSKEFLKILPLTLKFYHARISGEEIWLKEGPEVNIPQENCSVFAEPGEIVLGPLYPTRNKISKCMGIFYGEGKLLDGGNIFGKVYPEDLLLLKALGEKIWLEGARILTFTRMD